MYTSDMKIYIHLSLECFLLLLYFLFAEDKLNSRQKLNQQLFGRIRTDLEPWQGKGITLQQVERTYCTLFQGGFVDGGFRVQVTCLYHTDFQITV